MNIVKSDNGNLLTTSKIISDVFGKVHKKVIITIDKLECSDSFRGANFGKSYYLSPQNKKIPCYNITEDGFYFLCMGFTGKKAAKWKEEFLVTFKQMREGFLNVDAEMTKLSKQGKEIKQLGSDWSKFGHQINKQKKAHDKSVTELVNKVQFKLDLPC
tara:strand:- start:72 stop:545 length:474 start_codon:yes stop_codon:yes gene_type:complete